MERRYAKRNVRSIYAHMDKAMELCLGIADVFEEQHPPEAEAMRIIAIVVLSAQTMLRKWYEKVWGSEPGDWYNEP